VARRSNYPQDGDLAGLIARGVATADHTARGAPYRQVQGQSLQTGPYAALVQPEYPAGLRADLRGFVYSPFAQADFARISD
jgi:hypothetical protein